MRLLISAGEASGEMYGAQLIEALHRRVPNLECFGVGGERMQSAGCDLVVQSRELAVVGITEILPRLPKSTESSASWSMRSMSVSLTPPS